MTHLTQPPSFANRWKMKQIQALATSPNHTRYEQKTQVLVAPVFQVTHLAPCLKNPLQTLLVSVQRLVRCLEGLTVSVASLAKIIWTTVVSKKTKLDH